VTGARPMRDGGAPRSHKSRGGGARGTDT